jgi:hypothetical protein
MRHRSYIRAVPGRSVQRWFTAKVSGRCWGGGGQRLLLTERKDKLETGRGWQNLEHCKETGASIPGHN